MTNSRRKFLWQGSLATTVLIAGKPFDALAKLSSPFSMGAFNYGSVTIVHTTGRAVASAEAVRKIRNKTTGILLLHDEPQKQLIRYDASLQSIQAKEEGGYKIIDKDNYRVGVITATTNETNVLNRVNHLSALLKNEKGCHLVVCMSHLGYKNKKGPDDLQLADQSEHIDIIIGKHASNSPKFPMIARNKKRAEVIIQHTQDPETEIGKIRIGLDQFGNKFTVAF